MVAYGRVRTKENFKLLALKVVAATEERRSLTRGSKHSGLTWKVLVFLENWSLRRGGHLQEVVDTEVLTAYRLIYFDLWILLSIASGINVENPIFNYTN